MIDIRVVTSPNEKSAITETILRGLPDWFGLEASILEYIRDVARLHFLCAFDREKPVGFIVAARIPLQIVREFHCKLFSHKNAKNASQKADVFHFGADYSTPAYLKKFVPLDMSIAALNWPHKRSRIPRASASGMLKIVDASKWLMEPRPFSNACIF